MCKIFIFIALRIRPQHVLVAGSLIFFILCQDSSFTVYIEDSSSTLWIRPLCSLLWFYPLSQSGFVYPAYRRLVSIVSVNLSTVAYKALALWPLNLFWH